MVLETFLQNALGHGPVTGLVVLLVLVNGAFLARDWRRVQQQEERIRDLEHEIRTVFVPLSKDCRAALQAATDAVQQNSEIIRRFLLER